MISEMDKKIIGEIINLYNENTKFKEKLNNLYNTKIIENEKFISDQLEAIYPKHSLLHKFGKWITDNFY